MTTVRKLLDDKSHQSLVTIAPDRSTYEALQIMAEKDIGAVIVMENGQYLGLLTEREYARRIVLHGKTSRHTPVGETMNRSLPSVSADTTLDDCMALMTEQRVRYLPVFENNELIGVVSIGDVVKNVIANQALNIDHLERYITGG